MNRAGEYKTALSGIASYKAYKPKPLPPFPEIEMDLEMVNLLSEANNTLGKLEASSYLIPDVDLFLGSYVRKEALLSSQIEGTQATLEDIFNPESNLTNLDVNDVINYINALNFALKEMKNLPICNRLLCSIHKVLLSNVRGKEKSPGEFRKSQNWIGGTNSNLSNARYIPPTVEDMLEAMSALERFINESEMEPLLKIALSHYQFETIHPFLDGNGRIGRMLIILMLVNENILTKPVLYLSLYLKSNQIEYYERLSEVRKKGDYEQWIKFFLQGIISTCLDSLQTISQLDRLFRIDKERFVLKANSRQKIFDYLKKHPLIDIVSTSNSLAISYNTVSSSINELLRLGILEEVTSKSRNRLFQYSKYLEILKSGM